MPRAKRKVHPPIAVGEKIGTFTVIRGPLLSASGAKPMWIIQHTCGMTFHATKNSLRTKPRTYCPTCMVPSWTGSKRTAAAKAKIAAALTTHGMAGTPEYETWTAIQQRCHNPNNSKYSRYGKRGIVVSDRWRGSFDAFYEDMGNRPEGMTLERVDNDGPYSAENCVWAPWKTQACNKSNTVFVDMPEGRLPLQEIADRAGENAKAVFNRV